jgi:DNA-directed RNA polymerase subunit RPC12/RpoP
LAYLTIPEIKCLQCNNDFVVSEEQLSETIKCPFCGIKMDDKSREDMKNAILHLKDINYHFKKYHSERDEPLFQVGTKAMDIKLPHIE